MSYIANVVINHYRFSRYLRLMPRRRSRNLGITTGILALCLVGAVGGQVSRSQRAEGDLPPLHMENPHRRDSLSDRHQKRMRLIQLEMLIPTAPLICWSHSPAEKRDGTVVVDQSVDATPEGLPRAIVFDPLFRPPAQNTEDLGPVKTHHLCY